ncbi:hypothetical protein ACFL3G_07650 [Planctomycetota bacterium]
MKKFAFLFVFCCFLAVGCDSLRFAPSQSQKQNAWLHNRTAMVTAETTRGENASEKLQGLAKLSESQSRAFVSYYGLPKVFPPAETAEEILSESNYAITRKALGESADRPDILQVADGALELAIGISALLGGVYGTRAVRFLKEAKSKSKALQEIIAGNELLRSEKAEYNSAFKQAHKAQSAETRLLVAQLKG